MLLSLPVCFRISAVWLAFLVAAPAAEPAALGGEGLGQAFERALDKPFRASLRGESLRGALDAIAAATGIPYWLDRRVDPDQLLDPVAAGPDVEQAYAVAAETAGLATLPLDGLVLVGRADWVDRVGAAWLAQSEESANTPRPATLSVSWPPLTTPDEAIRRAGVDAAAVDLPHDLWPAFHSDVIPASTLWLLIGAQFDQWITGNERDRWRIRPLPERVSVVRRYPASPRSNPLRDAADKLDSGMKWKLEGQQTVVEANPRAHRLIARTLRDREGTVRGDKPRHRTRPPRSAARPATFRFELKNAPAGAALATLADSAGWTLKIAPQAEAACRQRISFDEPEDATLAEWVQRIAERVNLTAVRQGDVLLIEAK